MDIRLSTCSRAISGHSHTPWYVTSLIPVRPKSTLTEMSEAGKGWRGRRGFPQTEDIFPRIMSECVCVCPRSQEHPKSKKKSLNLVEPFVEKVISGSPVLTTYVKEISTALCVFVLPGPAVGRTRSSSRIFR